MWSDSSSFRSIAAQLPSVQTLYDKGDTMFTSSGKAFARVAPRNYLSTKDLEASDIANVNEYVGLMIGTIIGNDDIVAMMPEEDFNIVVWVALFGSPVLEIDDLGIDWTPFGHGVGLVVDNYTAYDAEGRPKKLVIQSWSSRSSATARG